MTEPHLREWELRKLRAGELADRAESARVHLSGCEACARIARMLDEETRTLEAEVPFERFARGVEAKLEAEPRRPSARRWTGPLLALAACLAVAVAVPSAFRLSQGPSRITGGNRIKGGAEIELRIAGARGGPQRVAAAGTPEVLGPGERVRIGYQPGGHRFVAAVLVDSHGEVDPLYPASGQSLPVAPEPRMHYLPGSLELTGKGAKKVIVVLSDSPLRVRALERAAEAAWRKSGGNVMKLPSLGVEGEQFQRTLIEP